MSLLLEALKKAALEKSGRGKSTAGKSLDNAAPASKGRVARPSGEPEVSEASTTADHEEVSGTLEKPATPAEKGNFDSNPETTNTEWETPSNFEFDEEDSAEEWDFEAEIEAESELESESEPVSESDGADFEISLVEDDDAEIADSPIDLAKAESAADVLADAAPDTPVDSANVAAAEKASDSIHTTPKVDARPPQGSVAPNGETETDIRAFLNQQESAEKEASRQSAEALAAEERQKHRAAEMAAQELAETRRQQEADKARKSIEESRKKELERTENLAALENLLKSGRAVAVRTKRRARFLYAMLFMTALGGILSYYFYLLATSNIDELQSTVSKPVVPDQAFVDEVLKLSDSSVEAGSGQEADAAGSVDLLAQDEHAELYGKVTTDPSNQGAMSGVVSARSTMPALTAVPQDKDLKGSVGIHNSGEQASGSAGREVKQTTRSDEPPRASDYLMRFTNFTPVNQGLSDPAAETQRVIVRHKPSEAEVSRLVQSAYQAFSRADFSAAESGYSRALKLSPANRDANLGLAAIAVETERWRDAVGLYQAWLAKHPNDQYVRAALLSIAERSGGDTSAGTQSEADIENMLDGEPESAHLHFMKGTQLAGQNRWREAQNAFFSAYYREPANPDYAYNLAVSLDHLGQSTEAERFYEQALLLSESRTARFSRDQILKRLTELQARLP